MKRWLIGLSLILVGNARATECGEARLAYAHYKAAAQIEQDLHHSGPAHDARSGLEKAEHQMKTACVAKKVGLSALPLGYVSLAPGNASKTTVELGSDWALHFSTGAGAANGIQFAEPAELTLPTGMKWESPDGAKGPELFVAVGTEAELTVEEPEAGKGTWKIEVGKTTLLPMTGIRACAGGKGDVGAKLDKATCQMLVRVDPFGGPNAVPEPGRAAYIGEWQYGWKSGLEVGDVEMSETPTAGPAARVDLPLSLSAPIPGVSDGKKLLVTLQSNGALKPSGAVMKLGVDCGNDDEACQKQREVVTVWYDRAFGVPLTRVRAAGVAKASAMGKVADRLARPMVGQRIMLIAPGRKVVTISDDLGEYHFAELSAGEATIFPVGKKPTDRPGKEESRKAMVGMGEAKVPILYVTKLLE
jgi:hypothetical protein